jgi:hypothetical protein
VQGTAAKCRDAWNLANLWRVRPGESNDDTRAFSQWLDHYKKKTENEVDSARLPDLLHKFLPELKRPKTVVAYAFDILPPQTKEFLDALGTEILFSKPPPIRGRFANDFRFREKGGRGRRAVGEGAARGGSDADWCCFPSLQEKRKEVVRVFSRVMGDVKPFNISIGVPLDQYPIVALALSVLRMSQEEIPFEEASRIIRSPFIGGAEQELAARMKLDLRLRDKLGATVSLPKLISFWIKIWF